MTTFTNNIIANKQEPPDWHVLVLHDGTEADIKGIWGPYPNATDAGLALAELQDWPIDGVWTTVHLKKFVVPPSRLNNDFFTTVTRPPRSTGVQLGDGNTQTNTYG